MNKTEGRVSELTENTMPKAPQCFQFSRGRELLYFDGKASWQESGLAARECFCNWGLASPQPCSFSPAWLTCGLLGMDSVKSWSQSCHFLRSRSSLGLPHSQKKSLLNPWRQLLRKHSLSRMLESWKDSEVRKESPHQEARQFSLKPNFPSSRG